MVDQAELGMVDVVMVGMVMVGLVVVRAWPLYGCGHEWALS